MPTPDSPLPVGTVVGGYRVVGTAGDDVRFVHYDAVSTSIEKVERGFSSAPLNSFSATFS